MSRSLDNALVALAQEPEGRTLALDAALSAAPERLGAVVLEQRIAGLAHRHARGLRDRVPAALAARLTGWLEQWNEERKRAWAAHLVTVGDLHWVAALLDGIPGGWAVVKGPVLAERAYSGPDLRSYLDLDILVHPGAYGAALHRLESGGAALLDRNWTLIRSSMRAELSLLVNGRTSLDLHWHLLNEAEWRTVTSWDMSALLARARTVRIGGVAVPVLERTDALVHLATHACLSGAHRLLWLKDIERQWAAYPVPPAEVESRARQAGLWPQVSLAMLRAATVFGLPRPAHLPAWTWLNRFAGCAGFRTGHGVAGRGRVIAAATRDTATHSTAALAAALTRHQAARLRRTGGGTSPATLADLRRDTGSPAERASYLADVARTFG